MVLLAQKPGHETVTIAEWRFRAVMDRIRFEPSCNPGSGSIPRATPALVPSRAQKPGSEFDPQEKMDPDPI